MSNYSTFILLAFCLISVFCQPPQTDLLQWTEATSSAASFVPTTSLAVTLTAKSAFLQITNGFSQVIKVRTAGVYGPASGQVVATLQPGQVSDLGEYFTAGIEQYVAANAVDNTNLMIVNASIPTAGAVYTLAFNSTDPTISNKVMQGNGLTYIAEFTGADGSQMNATAVQVTKEAPLTLSVAAPTSLEQHWQINNETTLSALFYEAENNPQVPGPVIKPRFHNAAFWTTAALAKDDKFNKGASVLVSGEFDVNMVYTCTFKGSGKDDKAVASTAAAPLSSVSVNCSVPSLSDAVSGDKDNVTLTQVTQQTVNNTAVVAVTFINPEGNNLFEYNGESSSSSGFPLWGWILIGVAGLLVVLLVVGGAGFAVYKMQKKRKYENI